MSPCLTLVPQGDHSRVPGPSAFPLPVPAQLSFSSSLAEASGAIEFVADPAALATILSGEGVKSCCLGRQPSLAQRVVVRGTQGGSIQRGQVIRQNMKRSGWGGLRRKS